MLQDGSLSLNHRLPTAYLPPRLAYRSFSYRAASIVLTAASSFLLVSPLRPSRRRLHLHRWFPSSSAICHMPTQLRPSLVLFLFLFIFLSFLVPSLLDESYVNDDQINWNRKIATKSTDRPKTPLWSYSTRLTANWIDRCVCIIECISTRYANYDISTTRGTICHWLR